MGVFGGIEKARSNMGGEYIAPGLHRLKIKALKKLKSQVNKAEVNFIAEMEVLESSVHLPGQTVSFIRNLTTAKFPEASLGDVHAFLYAAYSSQYIANGEDPPAEDDITEEAANYAVSEDNPLQGTVIDCEAFVKAGKSFTRTRWSVPDEVMEQRKAS